MKNFKEFIIEEVMAGAPGNNTHSVPGAGDDTSVKMKKMRLWKKIHRRHKPIGEETVNELSSDLLKKYRTAAGHSNAELSLQKFRGKLDKKQVKKLNLRRIGIRTANKKIDEKTGDISAYSKSKYYLQPDGSYKKGGDGRSEGLTLGELKDKGLEHKIK